MTNENKDKILDHNYDGIQEYDNPLPRWWLVTFWLTIIFSAGYYYYYEINQGPGQYVELDRDLKAIQELQVANTPTEETEEQLAAILDAPETITSGKAVYDTQCASCHGDKGQGLIGPNFTDNYWINGDGSRVAIVKTARKGVLEKGMPAWENVLSHDKLLSAVAYIRSLKGTNPAQAKEPQGVEYK